MAYTLFSTSYRKSHHMSIPEELPVTMTVLPSMRLVLLHLPLWRRYIAPHATTANAKTRNITPTAPNIFAWVILSHTDMCEVTDKPDRARRLPALIRGMPFCENYQIVALFSHMAVLYSSCNIMPRLRWYRIGRTTGSKSDFNQISYYETY